MMQDYSNYTIAFYLYLIYGTALGVMWSNRSAPAIPKIYSPEIMDVLKANGLKVRYKYKQIMGISPGAKSQHAAARNPSV